MPRASALLITLVAGWAFAETTHQTPNLTTFTVQEGSGGQLTAPAVFQGWPRLCVRACPDCADPCLPGDIYEVGGAVAQDISTGTELHLQMRAQALAGLDVQRKIYSPADGAANANGFVRYLDLLSNYNPNPVTVSVRLGSVGVGFGALDPTHDLIRTSSDDVDLEVTDRWFMTDDPLVEAGFGAVVSLIQGAGARVTPAHVRRGFPDPQNPGGVAWEYHNITVPSGGTVAFLTVIIHEQ
ncbi:hypothetical protein KKF91_08505, partial [Myxococcota bacterium]|nr:hypothetical protein [Myxococcota bacterium]